MIDQKLRTGLQETLNEFALPERFHTAFVPPRARRRSRLPAYLAAAAAAAIAVFAFSPLGNQAATAALEASKQVALSMGIRVATREETAAANALTPHFTQFDETTLKPGETKEIPFKELPDGSHQPRQVLRAVTLAEVTGVEAPWPVPRYRGPAPDAKAVLRDVYNDGKISSTSLRILYQTPGEAGPVTVEYLLARLARHRTEQELAAIRSGEQPTMIVHGDRTVEQQAVAVKGEPAQAISTDGGKTWEIHWYTATGQGSLMGQLPPAELAKMVDSLPDLN